ncbi:MAG: SAM-dependent methyltransferase [candidate division Zixibacteria bacterium]
MGKRIRNGLVSGSFRDPSGFLFYRDGRLYRQVNNIYRDNYDLLMNSGLYRKLVGERLLISHVEIDDWDSLAVDAYKIIAPESISFISYPYEWCFGQLKEAALTTLRIQKYALDFGMSLKDSSAYNIQFVNCRPIFIDTLSFEKYREGSPWVAYGQFCRHFLAPLTLMCRKDIRLNQMLRIYIDGLPLDLAGKLLPRRTWLKFSLLTHIHLHSESRKRFADRPAKNKKRQISRRALFAIIDSLEQAITGLRWKPANTEWADYYSETNYAPESLTRKKEIVAEYIEAINPPMVWDMGANTGFFSRIASAKGIETISFDFDPACVEVNYRECVKNGEANILPLLLDLSNPSPNIGWANRERMSLGERGPADLIMALALVHHLAISNNLPLFRIAEFFKENCRALIIEFIPKNDSQVRRLLATRDDIFPRYTKEDFEAEFEKKFTIVRSDKIPDSERTLYLMTANDE